jgi:hypothetical protein
MGLVWMTKYGPRRVRHEPPTLEEALAAAEGLTPDFDQQLEIAADLMDWPLERTKAEGEHLRNRRRATQKTTIESSRTGRSVIVERKAPRRVSKDAAKSPPRQRHQS